MSHQYFGEGLNFEFMGDRLESMMATVGLSFQVMPRLSVGLGGTLLNHASSVPQIYIPDASNQEDAQTTPIIEVEPTIAPHFGVHWAVSDQIDVSGALHMASDSRLTGNGRLRFWEFEYPEGQNQLNQPLTSSFCISHYERVSVYVIAEKWRPILYSKSMGIWCGHNGPAISPAMESGSTVGKIRLPEVWD